MRAHIPNHATSGFALAILAPVLAVIACSDPTQPDPTRPTATGVLRVDVSTSGEDRDADGYMVVLDGQERRSVGPTGFVVFEDVRTGSHSLELDGVATNCDVEMSQPVAITFTGSEIPQLRVLCWGTGLEVVVSTTGYRTPPPFVVTIGTSISREITANATPLRLTGFEPGQYRVSIDQLPSYCTVTGEDEVIAQVELRAVVPVPFDVSCRYPVGAIHVVTATSGTDPDPNGYLLTVDGRDYELPSTGAATIDEIAAGGHTVVLHAIASNCTVVGSTSRNLEIAVGELVPDTVQLAFQTECVRTQKIAYHLPSSSAEELGSVVVAYADGSEAVVVARGRLPAWSPDGSKLSYSDLLCYSISPWDDYSSCSGGLKVLDLQTGQAQAIPHTTYGMGSAWSPDGSTIAFVRTSPTGPDELAFVGLDGNPPAVLSLPVAWSAGRPTWSPDGQRVAFTCNTQQWREICVVRTDGSNLTRLAAGVVGESPAWSPEGSRLAFVMTVPRIALIPSDGGVLPVELGPGGDPAWSSDGTKILFAGGGGLFTMDPDGSNVVRITSGFHTQPAWRP